MQNLLEDLSKRPYQIVKNMIIDDERKSIKYKCDLDFRVIYYFVNFTFRELPLRLETL